MSNNNPHKANKKGLFSFLKEFFYFMKDNKNREIRKHFRDGVAYVKKNNYDNAIEEFQKIIDSKPDHFLAHLCLARLYYVREENEKALEEYSCLKQINLSRYKTFKLNDEHLKVAYQCKKKGLLNELADNLEKCAKNLTSAAKKMQGATKRQKKTLDKLTNLNKKFKIKSLDVEKVEIKVGEYGDFKDLTEYVKFLTLPPIAEKEAENTDWDKLISEILK